jgi:hypothetical protein
MNTERTEPPSSEEVRKICAELEIHDWTKLEKAEVTLDEARKILSAVNVKHLPVPVEDFAAGLEVELEHGVRFPEYNVTNNHPILTGKIVMAHFMETMDYYYLLDVAEAEGDLQNALASEDIAKARKYYQKHLKAKAALHQVQLKKFG